jgi:hypothetical protein
MHKELGGALSAFGGVYREGKVDFSTLFLNAAEIFELIDNTPRWM